MRRRLTDAPLTLGLTVSALSAAAVVISASLAGAAPPDHPGPGDAGPGGPGVRGDHLTVTVTRTGPAERDGTYELLCHPAGGDHPDPKSACDGLDEVTTWGKDPFAPVPRDASCTKIYGGPATARVTGTWAGRPVDTVYSRSDGCEMDRWDRAVPLLPALSARA